MSGRIFFIQFGELSERPSTPPSRSFAFYDNKNEILYLVNENMQYISLSSDPILPVTDTTSIVEDPVDGTKEMRIDVENVATSTVRILNMPNADVDLRKNNYVATVAPTSTDDSDSDYAVGSTWIDVTGDIAYICLDATTSAAIWSAIS